MVDRLILNRNWSIRSPQAMDVAGSILPNRLVTALFQGLRRDVEKLAEACHGEEEPFRGLGSQMRTE